MCYKVCYKREIEKNDERHKNKNLVFEKITIIIISINIIFNWLKLKDAPKKKEHVKFDV